MKRYYFFIGILIISIIGGIVYSENNSKQVGSVVPTKKEVPVITEDNDDSNDLNDPNNVTCLINKENKILDTWAPQDLVVINNDLDGKYYLRKEAADSWNTMKESALNDGIEMHVISAYRTKSYQEQLYNKYLATDPDNAPYYSAAPRSSEHELGLAIDVSYDVYLHHDLQESTVGKWMAKNAYKYGWIMRYPDNKTDITGYIFESWHYRYVGVTLATLLQEQGLTLEEYYQK